MVNVESDIVFIDKSKGVTSYDVIRVLKRKLKAQTALRRLRIGHAGTLDPLATGLLIIGIGAGTKKLNEYLKLPKVYEAEILLGISTDTGDITGEVLKRENVPEIPQEKIEKVLSGMIGDLKLAVPVYSAIKQGGEPLYKKVRRGESVLPPVKTMKVTQAKSYDISYDSDGRVLLEQDGARVVKVEFAVGSGTYIRSLAEEFGRRLGYPATVKELRRISVGDFDIKDAKKLEDF